MAALNLSQPPSFLQNVGEPPVPFKAWIRTFENYLLAMSESELPEARKRALLIHCLGAEGQRLFYTLTVADDKYATALEALSDFFTPKVNVVAERYRFRQRSQRPGETTGPVRCYVEGTSDNMSVREYGGGDDKGPSR